MSHCGPSSLSRWATQAELSSLGVAILKPRLVFGRFLGLPDLVRGHHWSR